jgi:membrane associated rhomboid family serine protease
VAGAEAAASRRPIVVWTLIALNVAVYVWTAVQARSIMTNYDSALFDAWQLAPVQIADGEWWRVVTSGFLHLGPIHIASNMFALWVLGRDMETVLGRGRFLALYLISLLGGSAAVVVFNAPNQPVAGASGAVFGLMGGLLVVLLRLKRPVGQVIGLIVINIVISQVVPGISLTAHIGGLVVGALVAAALVYTPARNRTPVQVGALAGVTVVLLAIIAVVGSSL